jgi:hypothetical protein
MRLNFLLEKFEVKLFDGEYKNPDKETYISYKSLIHLLINNMELSFIQYPVQKGFK